MTPEFVPHPYQEAVIGRAIEQPCLGKLLDPGLGKTAITLETFRRLRWDLEVSRLLVVAPLRPAYSVWPAEVAKWRQFEQFRVHILHGKGLDAAALEPGVADIYVINPEGLEWLRAQRWRWPEMLAVDESTKFKNSASGRSRSLNKIRPNLLRRSILTGTPAPNGYMDLHGQIKILDGGEALGPTKKLFHETFCVPIWQGYGYGWKVRESAKPVIRERIAPLVMRLDARDHLDLPELSRVERRVQLPAGALDLYKRLENDMVVQLERGEVVAVNAGVLTAKCRQVANGVVYLTEDGEISPDEAKRWEVIHDEKAKALADLVEELGGKPILVTYEHRHELAVIKKTLKRVIGKEPPHIGGDVSAKKGDELARKWNAGELHVLLAQPASAGHGLNLQMGGHHVAWYSIPWDLELYDQLVGRIWRQGQVADRVVVHHLVASETIDEVLVKVQAQKDREQSDLLDALKRCC